MATHVWKVSNNTQPQRHLPMADSQCSLLMSVLMYVSRADLKRGEKKLSNRWWGVGYNEKAHRFTTTTTTTTTTGQDEPGACKMLLVSRLTGPEEVRRDGQGVAKTAKWLMFAGRATACMLLQMRPFLQTQAPPQQMPIEPIRHHWQFMHEPR